MSCWSLWSNSGMGLLCHSTRAFHGDTCVGQHQTLCWSSWWLGCTAFPVPLPAIITHQLVSAVVFRRSALSWNQEVSRKESEVFGWVCLSMTLPPLLMGPVPSVGVFLTCFMIQGFVWWLHFSWRYMGIYHWCNLSKLYNCCCMLPKGSLKLFMPSLMACQSAFLQLCTIVAVFGSMAVLWPFWYLYL